MSDDVMGRAAMYLATLGVEVFPCRPREKTPAVARGFLTASADLATVAGWWKDMPTANVAIRPVGVVLDVDDRGPGTGPDALAALIAPRGPLPETWTASSGRGEGRHLHFRLPAGHPGVRGWLVPVPHLDIKSHATGYVVAPPSVHPSGSVYRWVAGRAPWECPLAEAPAWLLAMMRPVGDDTPTRSAAKSRRGVRPATPAERERLHQEVARLSQGDTPAAVRLRRLIAGEALFAEGGRNTGWRDLTQRLVHIVVGMGAGDALEDLLASLIEPSLAAESRVAHGGVTLDGAIDMAVRGLPRAEAERARDLDADLVLAECIPSLRTDGGQPTVESRESKIERIRVSLTPDERADFERVLADPYNANAYPATTTVKGGWAIRAAMTLGGWFVLSVKGMKETEACHPTPGGKADEEGRFFVSYTRSRFVQTFATQVSEPGAKPEWLALQWLRRAPRKSCLVFEERCTDPNAVNLYQGISATPREGDVGPWLSLLDYVTSGVDTQWLEKWLAYKLQNPLKPMRSVIFLCGGEGTGKSQLLDLYAGLFAPHVLWDAACVTTEHFNSHLEGRLLAYMDDIDELSPPEVARLKHLTTAPVLRLEEKFRSPRTVVNALGFVATSNEDPLRHAHGIGRRWATFDARPNDLGTEWYRSTWEPWLKSGGADAVAHRLLHMDLTGFSHMDRPVSTRLQENRLTALRGPQAFLSDVAEGLHEPAREGGPTAALGLDPTIPTVGSEYTLAQWMHMYQVWARSSRKGECSVRELSHALKWGGLTVRKTNGKHVARLDIEQLTAVIERVRKTGK